MQPSRLFRIDDLLEEPAAVGDDGALGGLTPMRVPTATELSRQILRLATMATVQHEQVAHERDLAAAANVRTEQAQNVATNSAKRVA